MCCSENFLTQYTSEMKPSLRAYIEHQTNLEVHLQMARTQFLT